MADNTGFRSARLGDKARGSSDPGPLCYWAGLEMEAGNLDLGTPSQKGRNLGELLLWNRKSCWCPGAGGAAENPGATGEHEAQARTPRAVAKDLCRLSCRRC